MKQLVCAKDVETLKEEGKTELYIDEDAIVTPRPGMRLTPLE